MKRNKLALIVFFVAAFSFVSAFTYVVTHQKKEIPVISSVHKMTAGYVVADFTLSISGNSVTSTVDLDATGGDVIKWRGVLYRSVTLNKKGKIIQAGPWQFFSSLWSVECCPAEWQWSHTATLSAGTYELHVNGSYGVPNNNLSSIPIWSAAEFITIN